MKRLSAFVRKEFYHIIRDYRTLMILFGMPIAQVLLFGFAITTEIRDAKIAILDKSRDEMTTQITEKILSSEYFVLSHQLVTDQEIEEVFRDGQTKIVLVFENSFSENYATHGTAQVQLIADASDPNTANTLVNYLQAIINDYNITLSEPLPFAPPMELASRMYYNPELKGVYYFVPGTITIILILISAMMTSISIAREKEMGTMEVLLTSPMASGQIILAKVIPYIGLALIDALLVFAMGKYIFGVPILGSYALLLLATLLFIMLALSLGILISTVSNSQQTALLLSLMVLMLPTILLSGFIFPIENMPLPLRIIANIIPAKWFIIVIKSIMLKGSGIGLIWKEMLVLLGFFVFFLGMSIKKFKVRLE
jgi:ABC-2 type transport system permease protein